MQKIPLVDLQAQYKTLQKKLDPVIIKAVNSTQFIKGPYVNEFEKKFAAFCGVKECIGVGNGTDALYIALKVLNIGDGDEVITSAHSFAATAEAIIQTGAKPVFADIDEKTYNINPAEIKKKITKRTKAIIPVHIYGLPCDMKQIKKIASTNKLYIIEDAAQAHGAIYYGRKAGSIGDLGCFSFYPGKNLGAFGDGGAIITNNKKLADKIRMYADHGRKNKYLHQFPGINSRLDGLQAAILGVKLDYLENWNKKRRKAALEYNLFLKNRSIILPIVEDHNYVSAGHLYVIRVEKKLRDKLIEYLKSKGIMAGIHYPFSLSQQPAFKDFIKKDEKFPVAEKIAKEIVSLPLFPEISKEKIKFVSCSIEEFGI